MRLRSRVLGLAAALAGAWVWAQGGWGAAGERGAAPTLAAAVQVAARQSAAPALTAAAAGQAAAATGQAVRGPPPAPQLEFEDLFTAVEQAAVFTDAKEFPDAVPKAAPQTILQDYRRQRPRSVPALRAFITRYFTLPQEALSGTPPAAHLSLQEHIDALWPQLVRDTPQVPAYSSLLPLPAPYVVPGGRFRELYYWDSYFTLLGLQQSGRSDLLADMVRDFAAMIDDYGHIPNGTRTYYLSRSQPPFFFEMVALLGGSDPAASWARYLPQLRREYAFWMRGAAQLHGSGARERVVRLADGAVLNRYWDDADTPRDESWREDIALAGRSGRNAPQLYRDVRAAAESGWDFSSRWFADARDMASIDTTQIVPVDLNSVLYGLEQAIRAGCQRSGDAHCARDFARRARARRRAIDHYLWDGRRGLYRDYHWPDHRFTAVLSAAMVYPLFTGAASRAQAAAVARAVRAVLLRPGGLATTTLTTGQQWDAPNGWAPLQWLAIRGLRDYGEGALAAVIACRWMVNVSTVYGRTGELVEKYDVEGAGGTGGGGEYSLQNGFGWTNGVARQLMALYPSFAGYSSAAQCPP